MVMACPSPKRPVKARFERAWAARQAGLGSALKEMGVHQKDTALLEQAVTAHHAALKVAQQTNSATLQHRWNNLGTALQKRGELSKDADTLRKAEEALTEALAHKNKENVPLDWEWTQNNLALAQRWLGAVTSAPAKLQEARDGYAACEGLAFEKDAPFKWAKLQWNIADLALTRYHLDPDPALLAEARMHVTRARAFFVEGSDYQTQRCDDLLTQINAAEAGS